MAYFDLVNIGRYDTFGDLPTVLVQVFEKLMLDCRIGDDDVFDPTYALQYMFEEWEAINSDEEFHTWLLQNSESAILYSSDDSGRLVRTGESPTPFMVPETLVANMSGYLLGLDTSVRKQKAIDIFKLYRDIDSLLTLEDYMTGYLICEEGRFDLIEKIKSIKSPKETDELSQLLLKTYAEVKGIQI